MIDQSIMYIAFAVNKILAESKSYANSLSSNFDPAGSSATVPIAKGNIGATTAALTNLGITTTVAIQQPQILGLLFII